MTGEVGSAASPRVVQTPSSGAVHFSLLAAGLPVALGEGRAVVLGGPLCTGLSWGAWLLWPWLGSLLPPQEGRFAS